MKRAYLHSIVSTMAVMAVFMSPIYGQSQPQGSYVFQNFTLSDFGDGYDAAKNLIWKPSFSDYAAQTPEGDQAADNQAADNQGGAAQAEGNQNGDAPVELGGNPDPARNNVRYALDKPDGISELVGGSQKYVLGVKAAFTKQGYNWIELHPYRAAAQEGGQANEGEAAAPAEGQAAPAGDAEGTNPDDQFRLEDPQMLLVKNAGEVSAAPDPNVEAESFPIPFAGKATDISVWVWGGHYGWWLEAYLVDYLGRQYRIPLGDLLYVGWMQKRSGIPESIVQGRKRIPSNQPLRFEMLKLWSFPSERVDSMYVYFDLLQHNGIVSTEVYNGKNLETLKW